MILTFAYRLLPTKSQHRVLEGILEDQRQLYNAALQERVDAYRKAGLGRGYFDQCGALTGWRRSDPDASALPANLQRWTLKRLDEAYKAFYRRCKLGGKAGFPRFRGKGRFASLGFGEFSGIRFDDRRLRFKGMPGSLRIHIHRPLPDDPVIRSCVFTRKLRAWQVAFAVEVPDAPLRRSERSVGLDLGIKTFATLSDGGFVPSLKAARRAERRLKMAQRAFDRKARHSAGRRKARVQVGRVHAAVARERLNHPHQASARIIRDYDVIAMERLQVKGLAQGAYAKDVRDSSWAKFISMLRYKAECAGCRLIEVDPRDTRPGMFGLWHQGQEGTKRQNPRMPAMRTLDGS